MRLTRRYRFSASHRLHAAQLSEGDNEQLYGKCNNPFGHGHDYVLDVSVRGPLDKVTGRIVDLEALDKVVHEQILQPFEHRYLNADVPEFARVVPTTENLVVEIKNRLERVWSAAFGPEPPALDKIRIQETKRNIIELAI
jgi:6-pyruvoyltetrahydropterin/6-carboxytetrahydropterin synthase